MNLPGTTILLLLGAFVLIFLSTACTKELKEENLFFPRRHAVVEEAPGRRNITIPIDDGLALRGWLLEPGDARTTVIYHYGNGETVVASRYRLQMLAKEFGVNVLAIDYRGYGFSDGTPSVDALVEDSIRIYDYLMESLGGANQQVVVYGRSIGTAAAIALASERPINAMMLEAPFTTISEVISAWNRNMQGPAKWVVRIKPSKELAERSPQPIDLIIDYKMPLLVMHGELDTVIPLALGERIFESCPSLDKTWCNIPGVGHNDLPPNHPTMVKAMREFMAPYAARAESP